MKLGLGTVQFGQPYGISNKQGQTSSLEVAQILEEASLQGISILDTASEYGSSEEVLGFSIQSGQRFQIVTKTPKLSGDTRSVCEQLTRGLERSLERLKQSSIYGLLFHNVEGLLNSMGAKLMMLAQELKARGLVKKIGASVYSSAEIDELFKDYSPQELELLQVPISILDQRLIRSGHLRKLKDWGVEVHARSVFLQGALLMEVEQLPSHFDSARGNLARFRSYLMERGLTPLEAAVGFVHSLEDVDVVLVGVNTRMQLREIGLALNQSVRASQFEEFGLDDSKVLNPALWK